MLHDPDLTTGKPDYLILCLSQPSLSARDAGAYLEALRAAGAARFAGPVAAIRLEGTGDSLADAAHHAAGQGARRIMVQPVGFPMAANIGAWLPGVVSHLADALPGDVQITLAAIPDAAAAADMLVGLALDHPAPLPKAVPASLGKAGWQFLPDHAVHILVCTGPRCAFRGAATLQAGLKARLAAAGLSDRCLTTTTGCLYPCNQGPMIAVYPQGGWFHVPDDAALDRIVTDVIGAGGDAPDLRLAEKPGSRRALTLSQN
jgi:(2Fe-2S) ferredoxin